MKVTVFEKNVKADVEIPPGLRILEDREKVPKGFSSISIINPEDGDKRLVWNSNNITEIQQAKDLFDELVEKGMVPYCIGPDGGKAEPMTTFDPFAEEALMADKEILLTPQKALAGG